MPLLCMDWYGCRPDCEVTPVTRHEQTREQSRRTALCAMLAALSVVILCLGGVIPLATFVCPMLARMTLQYQRKRKLRRIPGQGCG